MSAASIAAMAVCISEDERRRRDPEYEPVCSLGALIDCEWAGPVLLLISILFSAAMIYISVR